MPIQVACLCGLKTSVSNAHAGKRAKCPSCQNVLVVPQAELLDPEEAAAQALLQDDEAASEPTPTASKAPPRSAPQQAPRAAYQPDPVEPYTLDESAPKPKIADPLPPKPKKVNIEYKAKSKSEDRPQRAGVLGGAVILGLILIAIGAAICAVRPIYGGFLVICGLFRLITGLLGITVEDDD